MRSGVAAVMAAWKGGAIDEVEVAVNARVRELRVSNFRRVMQVGCLIVIPDTLYVMMAVASGEDGEFTVAQDAILLLAHGVLAVVFAFPGAVTWKTLDVFYGTLALCLILPVLPWLRKPDAPTSQLFLYGIPLALLNVMRACPLLALATGLAWAAAVGSGALVHAQPERWSDAGNALIYLCLGIPVCSHTLESSTAGCIRHGLQGQLAREALAAATALLKRCCDVVFETDQDGLIASPAENLGGMLLQGPGRCLQNVRLADLLPREADKAALAAKLRSADPSGDGLAEAIHVHMRDVMSNVVHVELLSFQFRHLDERPRYMVGLRESTDTQGSVGALPECPTSVGAEYTSESSAESRATAPGDEEASLADSSAVDTGSVAGLAGRPLVTLTVDAECECVHIQECSEEFAARIGHLGRGALLASLVQHSAVFRTWIQAATNMALSGRDEPPCSVILMVAGRRVKARCRVLREEAVAGGESDFDSRNVCLVFSSIRQLPDRDHALRRHGSAPRVLRPGRGTPVLRVSL